jgi:hypothetical protein
MEFTLKRIKRLIIQGKYIFTEKAAAERIADGLSEEDVLEAILNATFVRSKKSRSPWRKQRREEVYIIESFTYDGILVYTKGVIRKVKEGERFYILISAKRSTMGVS